MSELIKTIKVGDFEVNRIGLGTNRIGDNDESRVTLKKAIELGVNFIDTAHRYGRSEEIIGQTLAPYSSGTIIATKGGWSEDNTPQTLGSNIDQSLRLLNLKTIDLWQLHRADPNVPIEETMKFLKTQQDAGKIRHIGLSAVTIEQIEKARSIVPIVSVQNQYNLRERQNDDVVDYCTKEGIVFIAYFPLGSGAAASAQKLNEITQKYQATPTQIALAWLLKRSPMMLPIPGTLNPGHLASNLGTASINLSQEDFAALSNI